MYLALNNGTVVCEVLLSGKLYPFFLSSPRRLANFLVECIRTVDKEKVQEDVVFGGINLHLSIGSIGNFS